LCLTNSVQVFGRYITEERERDRMLAVRALIGC
jgi:hypothetical protein